jgi:hypothetical protein
MKALEQLRHHYFMARMGIEDAAPCVQWAVDRLMANEEGEDCNVALLAGTKSEQERLALA